MMMPREWAVVTVGLLELDAECEGVAVLALAQRGGHRALELDHPPRGHCEIVPRVLLVVLDVSAFQHKEAALKSGEVALLKEPTGEDVPSRRQQLQQLRLLR
jgi:hypothetical protein